MSQKVIKCSKMQENKVCDGPTDQSTDGPPDRQTNQLTEDRLTDQRTDRVT